MAKIRASGRVVYGSDKEGGGPYAYPDPNAPRDVSEFAHVLYDRFRSADAREVDVLLVVNPPATDGLGAAVADRVWRASH